MPRIKAVKPRAFCSTQDPDTLPERLDLALAEPFTFGETLSDDLSAAVEADYAGAIWHGSDDAQSDIFRMWDEGYPIAAAWILYGATENATLDAVLWAYRFAGFPQGEFFMRADADLDMWSNDHEAWRCPACNGVTYGDDMGPAETCSSCGETLTENDRIEDD